MCFTDKTVFSLAGTETKGLTFLLFILFYFLLLQNNRNPKTNWSRMMCCATVRYTKIESNFLCSFPVLWNQKKYCTRPKVIKQKRRDFFLKAQILCFITTHFPLHFPRSIFKIFIYFFSTFLWGIIIAHGHQHNTPVSITELEKEKYKCCFFLNDFSQIWQFQFPSLSNLMLNWNECNILRIRFKIG